MGKDPIAYEIDVEISSDEILARAKAKLNRTNKNLLKAQTEAKDAALNLQNVESEKAKAEEEKK
ncbi:hypothetical protein [Peptoniphilus raoultii]|uniref:hypothetical protein n=1 Tax=Peptoniphilus raoultii TaxID=1776387 RepID=UPI0008D94F66|nr:hypothetical protein [Peptoniphilus raoultii]